MATPFTGVDPYLESQGYWPDFHTRFVTYWCAAVSDALPESYEARMDERVQRETLIEILHRPERSMVAVLELLSPPNKTKPGRAEYLHMRMGILSHPVHMVELDLLLGGERLPMGQALPPGDFYATGARAEMPRRGLVYPWTLRDRLPKIPIPLHSSDGNIVIDLAAVFATAYERGRYARSVDCSAKVGGPMSDETAAWVAKTAQEYEPTGA